jgi:hypothetical protein
MWPGVFPSRKSTTLARAAAFRYKLSRIQLLALTTREDYELGKTDYPPDVLEKVYSKALLKCVLGRASVSPRWPTLRWDSPARERLEGTAVAAAIVMPASAYG